MKPQNWRYISKIEYLRCPTCNKGIALETYDFDTNIWTPYCEICRKGVLREEAIYNNDDDI